MGRDRIDFALTEEEEETLRMWVRSGKTEQRLVKRAMLILEYASGDDVSIAEAGRRAGLGALSASKWLKRFSEERLDGLYDEQRSGRPAVIPPEDKLKVISLACTKPPDGSNAWTTRKLEAATGISRATISRILSEAELKPHKVEYWCGTSPDPEFEEKQAAILGLYLDPPDNALVLSVDEKSQIQALDRTQPELPMRSGNPRRLTHSYKRHGTTCLLAALAVHEGNVDARCVDRHTHEEFLAFLKYLHRKYPRKQLHIIIDNFSAHKHKKVLEWAEGRKRITLHFTPTYASWLNQVEIWFNIFTKDVIRGGVWKSKGELIERIMHYIRKYNEEKAKPFAWTYTGKPLAA